MHNSPEDELNQTFTRFNLFVIWLIYQVITERSLEIRTRYLIRYYEIARICFKQHNYASLYQLHTALSSLPMKVLTKTWE